MTEPGVREIFPLRIFDNGLPVDADFRPIAARNAGEPDATDDTTVADPTTDISKSETHKVAAKD